nr:ATP-dependent zinc protease [Stutzerimonas balearica]
MLRLLPFAVLLSVAPVMAEEPRLYGRYENIRVEPLSQVLPAKMDTGAMTASLSATDIQRFERDGQPWVRFRLAVEDAGDTWYERPLIGFSEIKQRVEEGGVAAEGEPPRARRPLVSLELCIGDERREAQVNLTDRSHFDYPLLIGAETIRDLQAAVDPAQRYTAGRPSC